MKHTIIAAALIAVLILAAGGCKPKKTEPAKSEKPAPQAADTSAGKEKLVMDLLDAMEVEKNMIEEQKKIVDDMVDRIPGIVQASPGADMLKKREIDDLTAEITPGVRKRLTLDMGRVLDPEMRVEKIYKPLYMKHFTAEEIAALIDFFESPAGKKYSRKTVDMSREIEKKNWEMLSQDIQDIASGIEQEIRRKVLAHVEPEDDEDFDEAKPGASTRPGSRTLNRDMP